MDVSQDTGLAVASRRLHKYQSTLGVLGDARRDSSASHHQFGALARRHEFGGVDLTRLMFQSHGRSDAESLGPKSTRGHTVSNISSVTPAWAKFAKSPAAAWPSEDSSAACAAASESKSIVVTRCVA